MARNKRKTIKDPEKLKKTRKKARKRWRQKKAQEKAMKAAAAIAGNSATIGKKEDQVVTSVREVAEQKIQEKTMKTAAAIAGNSATIGRKEDRVVTSVRELAEQKRGEPANRPRRQVDIQHHVKEINPLLVVRTEKFLGSGTFGNCYLAYYRDLLVTVKEFKSVKKWTTNDLKKEVRQEARMISYPGDHSGVPLLFGVITTIEPLRLITTFHGRKHRSLTLSSAIRKKNYLEKPGWLGVLTKVIEALAHIHSCGILHNDLKANNIVLEERENGSVNPVIIDFGKASFASDAKPAVAIPISKREEYQKRYPHIAPEIVCGTGMQSYKSDIFSFGRIARVVLDLLPTATARSIKMAKSALNDDPEQHPSLKSYLRII
ncbi:misshapen-like kinase 1 [Montipora foliosa]|uniref:misshapen-like kinase 1 n=1 Tax=Montipora foliosa TaxID=591990 RepID=UPI0035F1A0F9